jgi:hypothetical protein
MDPRRADATLSKLADAILFEVAHATKCLLCAPYKLPCKEAASEHTATSSSTFYSRHCGEKGTASSGRLGRVDAYPRDQHLDRDQQLASAA